MKLIPEKRNGVLFVTVAGRLDASWADFFTETMLRHVRDGERRIVLRAEGLEYLSSAGIRALLALHRELEGVNGGFLLAGAPGLVRRILEETGFDSWLDDDAINRAEDGGAAGENDPECRLLSPDAEFTLVSIDAWTPWSPVDSGRTGAVAFSPDVSGVGIGAPADDYPAARNHCGEFVAVAGRVALLPPEESGKPDFLLPAANFVPVLQCVQALAWRGAPSHLFRFAPSGEHPVATLGELAGRALELTGGETAALTLAGEIDGLVGAALQRSPGRLESGAPPGFPGVRDWLRFCGERVFPGEQALVAGVAARRPDALGPDAGRLPALGGGLYGHFHAAVFPGRPLPDGEIEAGSVAETFFSGAAPRAVMHLVDDRRPGGLGESALRRGAVWCGRLRAGKKEVRA